MNTILCTVTFLGLFLCHTANAVDILRLYGHGMKRFIWDKKNDDSGCPPIRPFSCPNGGVCLPLQYICDGSPDCPDGYDEDSKLCTAAIRPPVEETANFLMHLLKQNGPNFLEVLFGDKGKDALKPMGGVEAVSVALSESKTLDDFGKVLHLMGADMNHLRSILTAIKNNESGVLSEMGVKDSAITDIKFFLDKLVNTGFI